MGRIYTEIVSVGNINIYQVSSDPNGALFAPIGSLAIRSDTADFFQNTDGFSTWTSAGGVVPTTYAALTDTDVTTSMVVAGQMVAYDGSQWTNQTPVNWSVPTAFGGGGESRFVMGETVPSLGSGNELSSSIGGAFGTASPIASVSATESSPGVPGVRSGIASSQVADPALRTAYFFAEESAGNFVLRAEAENGSTGQTGSLVVSPESILASAALTASLATPSNTLSMDEATKVISLNSDATSILSLNGDAETGSLAVYGLGLFVDGAAGTSLVGSAAGSRLLIGDSGDTAVLRTSASNTLTMTESTKVISLDADGFSNLNLNGDAETAALSCGSMSVSLDSGAGLSEIRAGEAFVQVGSSGAVAVNASPFAPGAGEGTDITLGLGLMIFRTRNDALGSGRSGSFGSAAIAFDHSIVMSLSTAGSVDASIGVDEDSGVYRNNFRASEFRFLSDTPSNGIEIPQYTPTSNLDPLGNTGSLCSDAGFLYMKTLSFGWGRVALDFGF